MESRNILNYLGAVIGVLQLPIGTPEWVWQAALEPYARPPLSGLPLARIKAAAAIDFGRGMVHEMAAIVNNAGLDATAQGLLFAKTGTAQAQLLGGYLAAASASIGGIILDSTFTQAVKDSLQLKITNFLATQ